MVGRVVSVVVLALTLVGCSAQPVTVPSPSSGATAAPAGLLSAEELRAERFRLDVRDDVPPGIDAVAVATQVCGVLRENASQGGLIVMEMIDAGFTPEQAGRFLFTASAVYCPDVVRQTVPDFQPPY